MARIRVAIATILWISILSVERTFCFNFETRLPVIKEGPGSSYFGFSVAEHIITNAMPEAPFSDSVVLVGAPIYQTDIAAEKPGGVFSCPFTSNYSDCSLLELDTDAGSTGVHGKANKNNQWLGVSVVSEGPGGSVAACAHRYKNEKPSIDEIQGLGKCYILSNELVKDPFTADGLMPCAGITRSGNYEGNRYKYCQAGTDLAISEIEYIMGIPGSDNWLGGIATSNLPNQNSRNLITPLDYLNNGVSYNSYLGFSVASAKFAPDDDLMFVAGAPRSDAMGAVVIMRPKVSTSSTAPVYRIDAEKPSSSFGYDVAVADLNGDGYDDLIVGAPQFFDRQTEAGGRVYVYENKALNGKFDDVEPIKITGPRDSLFGQVVANIGDLNGDNSEEFAVGAPYENFGEGAVYIYLGSASDLVVLPEVQKIRPSQVINMLTPSPSAYPFPNATFGYSLSGGVDLDGNGYPDLAIGAYEQEQIVIFRGRPVLTMEVFGDVEHTKLDPNSTNCEYSGKQTLCFWVQVCFSYFTSRPLSNSVEFTEPVNLTYDIMAEEERRSQNLNSRVLFEESGNYALKDQSIQMSSPDGDIACTDQINVVIKPTTSSSDIFSPIYIRLNYSLPEVPAIMPEPGAPLPSMDNFPIIDMTAEPVVEMKVEFEKECAKDDGLCITDLSLDASLDLTGTPPLLEVGVVNDVVLSVSIENKNEDAYEAKLTITYPVFLEFVEFEDASAAISYACKEEGFVEGANFTSIICDLGNPYKAGSKESFRVRYDARIVPPDAEEFNITIESTSNNDGDSNELDNDAVLTVKVESVTDIIISGKGTEQIFFSGFVRGESDMKYFDDIGLPVDQEWLIFNKGPGSVNTALVTIDFPVEVKNGKWLLYLTELPYVEDNKGVCNVTPPHYVNELGLKAKGAPGVYQPVAPPTTRAAGLQTQSRKKREVTAAPSTSNGEDTAGKIIELDCSKGTANCVKIVCDLDPLTAQTGMNEIKIIIKARFWNSTFLEDYFNVKEVKIYTSGSVIIESAPYIKQNTENDNVTISMKVTPDVKTLPPSQPLQWWIILLAVLGGLLLLILLIILLWKCGFFERKTGYKYATVTQQQASGKAKTEKTGYYDDMYYPS